MISANPQRIWRLGTAALLLALVVGCGPVRVDVHGNFPAPLIEPLPLTLGVWYGEDFSQHEFFDEAKSKRESSWIVHTGAAQVQMWDTLLAGMFQKVVHLDHKPEPGQPIPGVNGVLIPHIDELQYTIPAQTRTKVYEIWMRYRLELLNAQGAPVSEWTMSSYGKTPTAILQSDQDAVNLAAVMALRDAGAHFASSFAQLPAVHTWLQEQGVQSGEAQAGTVTP